MNSNSPVKVEIGNTRDKPGLRDSWFLKIDASNVLPISPATDATLVNSIARSLGIHDFYTVGLWNYCAGYNDECVVSLPNPCAVVDEYTEASRTAPSPRISGGLIPSR